MDQRTMMQTVTILNLERAKAFGHEPNKAVKIKSKQIRDLGGVIEHYRPMGYKMIMISWKGPSEIVMELENEALESEESEVRL